jgi:pyrroline-5-carboxylate reductase
LITQTIIGAGEMLKARTEPAAVLRENVTSPNGTTAAGLETLADFHFKEAVESCVESAADRSRELGKE